MWVLIEQDVVFQTAIFENLFFAIDSHMCTHAILVHSYTLKTLFINSKD